MTLKSLFNTNNVTWPQYACSPRLPVCSCLRAAFEALLGDAVLLFCCLLWLRGLDLQHDAPVATQRTVGSIHSSANEKIDWRNSIDECTLFLCCGKQGPDRVQKAREHTCMLLGVRTSLWTVCTPVSTPHVPAPWPERDSRRLDADSSRIARAADEPALPSQPPTQAANTIVVCNLRHFEITHEENEVNATKTQILVPG